MLITPKKYQQKAFDDLSLFCQLLAQTPKSPYNAWKDFWLKHKDIRFNDTFPKAYQGRYTDEHEPIDIANACFHIPTGGGKTIMACEALRIIQHTYLQRPTGLVLWLVPSDIIYTQTLKAFQTLESAERQLLKNAGLNRVKILEHRGNKRTPFSKNDVDTHLCIMLLTIQSFNAKSKDRKIRQASGAFSGFFPDDFYVKDHQTLLEKTANLETYTWDELPTYASQGYRFVKNTLENVFRLCRPVVIVDEAHNLSAKAKEADYKNALQHITGYNPSFMMEITATPKPNANCLVKASGLDLLEEQMIKLPINIRNVESSEWQTCVKQALLKRNELEAIAKKLEGETGIYVRPILLISVERTGEKGDLVDSTHIHIEDVYQFLLTQEGVQKTHIRRKTASVDELKTENLLSRGCSVRYILTKKAVAEGWNCPFAYVLCSVDRGTTAANSLTQLVGRILRQPYTKQFTGYFPLNESYVYALNTAVKETYDKIKQGLESEGYSAGLIKSSSASETTTTTPPKTIIRIECSENFKEESVLIPQLTFHEVGKPPVAFSWEAHLLPFIDYQQIKVKPFQDLENKTSDVVVSSLANLNRKGDVEHQQLSLPTPLDSSSQLETLFIVREFHKWIPNAWVAYEVIKPIIPSINASKEPFKALEAYTLAVKKQVYAQCKTIFLNHLESGKLKFSLTAETIKSDLVWHPIPFIEADEEGIPLFSKQGAETTKNLYSPVLAKQFNEDEKEVALYLDEIKAVDWWFRIVERKRGQLKLKGWERRNIYPDFLVKKTLNPATGEGQYLLLETKGEQLLRNEDTHYKQTLLEILAQQYQVVGSLKTPRHMASLVLALEGGWKWKTELNTLLTVSV
jgi:type III restriction enzyme